MVRTRCRRNQRNLPGWYCTTLKRNFHRTNRTIYNNLEQPERVSGPGLALSLALALAASAAQESAAAARGSGHQAAL